MFTPADVVSKIGSLQKLIPVVKEMVDEIGPASSKLGADAGQIASGATQLVADLEAELVKLKDIAAQNTSPAA